ncbi:site-specific DNA-methyltransferase [Alloyangia pacifica]|uniref:site-specific DNA-methyltransferase (adenine-specific) n=1 Tax=Alloyangia pacifica TaxID=311180 RepID=A0A2U8HEK7_9RHOB|nr:DNA methyltransferase [Alloyangia pacifica]AWI84272.1 site-specific DNA-methyltransferase [Alloyangia pacifica]
MSRLTDLIAQAKSKDADLGRELEQEFKALASRRSFGLNFERHTPESVELPGRPIRKGDKVRVLPLRGSTEKGDKRLWKVTRTMKERGVSVALLDLIGADEPETQTIPVENLIVVAEFRDYIYPGLVSTGKVERGGDKPFHTVINGENFHALEALTFTHRGKVDVIYIDPPYNTGAKDWKYNNDYVEGDDLYRHSKWLAFMERRLKIAKELLNPSNSTLIVTIDEKEYLRLGLLLEQSFPEAQLQMVSTIIKPEGTNRFGEFSRTNEFVYVVMFGDARVEANHDDMSGRETISEERPIEWRNLRRRENTSVRSARPNQFYAVFVDPEKKEIHSVGDALALNVDRETVPVPDGCFALFPLKPDGTEMLWGVTPEGLRYRIENGFARVRNPKSGPKKAGIQYLASGTIEAINAGEVVITGKDSQGAVDGYFKKSRVMPKTTWNKASHNAQTSGTLILNALLAGRKFPFPKSLYAVEDSLRFFVGNKRNAVVLDFFSGSGTTAHAVMRLNRQDAGRRQCISITNNEVGADEQKALSDAGLRPGDPDWEKWGICDYITKPRIRAAITGQTPEGEPVKGDYKFTDEFPMAEGFEENAEFFTLTYETPVSISHNMAFARIAPLLWMRAGSEGRCIDTLPGAGWAVADTYGLLTDLDTATPFVDAVEAAGGIRIAYIVTDDDRRFQSVTQRLAEGVEPVRLYESYLTNFRFSMGR